MIICLGIQIKQRNRELQCITPSRRVIFVIIIVFLLIASYNWPGCLLFIHETHSHWRFDRWSQNSNKKNNKTTSGPTSKWSKEAWERKWKVRRSRPWWEQEILCQVMIQKHHFHANMKNHDGGLKSKHCHKWNVTINHFFITRTTPNNSKPLSKLNISFQLYRETETSWRESEVCSGGENLLRSKFNWVQVKVGWKPDKRSICGAQSQSLFKFRTYVWSFMWTNIQTKDGRFELLYILVLSEKI